jgi:hypothetical protein
VTETGVRHTPTARPPALPKHDAFGHGCGVGADGERTLDIQRIAAGEHCGHGDLFRNGGAWLPLIRLCEVIITGHGEGTPRTTATGTVECDGFKYQMN